MGGVHGLRPCARLNKPTLITPPKFALVIDTETTTDATQALNFGSYRFIALAYGKHAPGSCLEEGIFYADELPERYPEGLAVLRDMSPPMRPTSTCGATASRYTSTHAASS